MEPHRLALPIGFQIEHFRIEAVLGRGGFGITYLAVDLQLGKRVAIKELLPDTIATRVEGLTVVPHSVGVQDDWEWARERFLEEARTLATFSHPAIVGVHRLIEANGTVYMVMDYVEGESYEARLQRIGTEPDQESLMAVIGPILSGLEEVHSHGLLHRDIKPENILIDKRGQPVLIDFGSARESVGKTMTMTSIVTHGYSPIEQYQTKGRMGPWTDIYAIAAVMCRAITGEKPPEAPDRIVEDEFVWLSYCDLPGFSATFSQSVDWALRVRPEERPQLVPDFVQQLTQSDGFAAERSELRPEHDDYSEENALPDAAVPPTHSPAVVPKRNRLAVPILTATAVVLLLVSAGAYMVASERSKRLAAEQAAAEQAQEMLRREEQAAKEAQEKKEEEQRAALAQKQAQERAAAELAQKELEAKRKAEAQAEQRKVQEAATKEPPQQAVFHTQAAVYAIDPEHSTVFLRVKHLGMADAYGRFNELAGEVRHNAQDPAQSKIKFTVRADSIDTNYYDRDKHLRGPDFFNAAEFPELIFESTAIEKKSDTDYRVTGDFTVRGTTKPVTFDFQVSGTGKNMQGRDTFGGRATFTVKRSDFGINYLPQAIGDDVTVMVSLEGIKQ
jgi:polyisoprenoid-binding protein YceI/serine/threonine protein kinase